MLNLNSILIFSENPKELAGFYSQVLGKEADMAADNYYGFMVGSTFLNIGPHDKVKGKSPNPERMMINFETNEVELEFERIKDLGATVVAEPYGMSEDSEEKIATFADPDGNYFQLISPWENG